MFPAIEASEVGNTGLAWLFLSYGYVLYSASEMISEGSDLLLLVPSLAGLVGSVVLPLLGAVPDGAIMLFSGLGDIESAQETLSVGVGALAGSTIMLLTIPWALSVYSGRVLIVDGEPKYKAKNLKTYQERFNSLTLSETLNETGIGVSTPVYEGAKIMLITTIPYFLIQIPASYLENVDPDNISVGEKNWALLGLIICLVSFTSYLIMQYNVAKKGEHEVAKMKQLKIMKNLLSRKSYSLSALLMDLIGEETLNEMKETLVEKKDYGSVSPKFDDSVFPHDLRINISKLLREFFAKYDTSGDQVLDKNEIYLALSKDLNECISKDAVQALFDEYDVDKSGGLNFDEFRSLALNLVKNDLLGNSAEGEAPASDENEQEDEEEIEDEELKEKLANLSPAEQQRLIKKEAFTMLATGTAMVLVFSDPMVDVMSEMAYRGGISPFYVAFVLAPLASNASEVLASTYYAGKKTSDSITISLSALEGAAIMNNTFCLSIFMGLIYFRGLAWQYTAETISIVLVQFILAAFSNRKVQTSKDALQILCIFPLSIVFVALLEKFGYD